MLRLRTDNSDQPNVPIQVDRMGIGRGMGTQDGLDAQTLESLVIMTDEIAAFERDAMGLGPVAMPNPPRSLLAVAPKRGLGWMPRLAGLAAAIAIAAALSQHFRPATSGTPALTAGSAVASGKGGGQGGSSFAHATDRMIADRELAWTDPNGSRRMVTGGSMARIMPASDDSLASEERSLILAVFQDDDSPWCECVRVQSGTLCSGQRVDQLSKDELVAAAMDSSCMVGAERVSIFAFTGPASKLPATREEAEALAITLSQLPAECLKSDPCVQHVASECMPSGVAMVSQTLALNDSRPGW